MLQCSHVFKAEMILEKIKQFFFNESDVTKKITYENFMNFSE